MSGASEGASEAQEGRRKGTERALPYGRWELPAGLTEDELLEGYRFARPREGAA